MGLYLMAKKPNPQGRSYLRINVFQMTFLRSAMLAAGVKESLVHKKFLANDGYLVTPLQSRTIAEQLRTWLQGRNLVVDLIEQNERARDVNNAVLRVFERIGDSRQKAMARQYRRGNSIPLRLSRPLRKTLRYFADFCDRSGGFGVR